MKDIPNMQVELHRILRLAGCDEGLFRQGNVLTAQVGDHSRCIYHLKALPQDDKILRASAKRALGDIFVQAQITCNMWGFDSSEAFELGVQAFREQMAEVVRLREHELQKTKES